MYLLAVRPVEEILAEFVQVEEAIYLEKVVISPWPEKASSRLQIKHGIVAVYEAGTALAKIPITTRGLVPRLYAILSLEGQQIGVLKWLHKFSSQNSEANSTVSLVGTQNSTDALQMSRRVLRTTARGKSEITVDPEDPKLQIKCERGDKILDLPEVFSAYMEAMATAGFNDDSATGAHVQAVSVSGDVVLNVYGYGITSRLSWRQLLQSLLLVWLYEIAEDNAVELDFELSYEGALIGYGFIWSLNPPPPRPSLLSF